MPMEGFVAVNGVRLQYFDWGSTAPPLVMIAGVGDDARIFDGIAAALSKRFHVIAYSRRGSGGSEGDGPYDGGTLTEDLLELMDALEIPRAVLVGFSAGGNEVTRMAAQHPERVGRIVYLESAYDWADPDFRAVVHATPVSGFAQPAPAMASFAAYLSYQHDTWYPELADMSAVEGLLRSKVIIRRDGSLEDRTPSERVSAHLSAIQAEKPRDYRAVKCPVLAVYGESLYDLHVRDVHIRASLAGWEKAYWAPFQAKSLARAQRELADVKIVKIRGGAHVNFLIIQRERIVSEMRRFLDTSDR
jgi:pimeloyl-ACP methyl ester carboxylesterase